MSAPTSDRRLLAAGITTLIVVSLVSVGFIQLNKDPNPPAPQFADVRLLTFADDAEASVVIRTVEGEEVARFERGTNAFARILLRAMNRERRKHGVDMQHPFQLGREASGLLVLFDAKTGTRITLDAFGPTNANVFAELMQAVPS